MKKLSIVAVFTLFACARLLALPTLQLDIDGGFYDNSEESTVTDSDFFDLYALLLPDDDSTVDVLYRISAALIPSPGHELNPPPVLGTFSIDGVTYDVTGDMQWGVPPLDLLDGTSEVGKDLNHGVFDTYFLELDFFFSAAQQMSSYDVQDDPTAEPGDHIPGSGMYYRSFAIDISNLDEGYGIHFDLYQVGIKANKPDETSIVEFAPFSHDASTDTHRHQVPDSATTVSLLGVALVGLAGLRRRLSLR